METHPPSGFGGPHRDQNDFTRLRHARERDLGFPVGQFVQTPPMLFTRDGLNVFLGDIYRGHTAFLVCGGPSLNTLDLSQLERRGILTMAVNNAASVVRPRLWCSVDDPGNFCDAIWYDPGIFKFIPLCHMEKHFMERSDTGELVKSVHKVGDMPATFGYRRNEAFDAAQFLHEDTVNWGNHSNRVDAYGNKGSRSVMLAALRLLYFLGVRRVFMIGCDFRMEHGQQNYAFEQDRSKSSVRGNNGTYRIMNDRLRHLKPHFEKAGYHVFNSTPGSGLTVFPYVPFEEAIELSTSIVPETIITAGMYDRQAKEKERKKEKKAEKHSPPQKAPAKSNVQKDTNVDRAAPKNGKVAPRLTREDILSELTLLLAVDSDHIQELETVWPTWKRFRPEFATMPIVVSYDANSSDDESRIHQIIDSPNLRTIPWTMKEAADQRELMLTSFVHSAAREVRTRWYLKLDTDVVAVSSDPWLDPAWFEESEDGRLPAFISSPWGYTKPANALETLDDWGDSVESLSNHPRLDIPYDARNERVRHPRIISWCFYGRTDWTREVTTYVNGRLPVPSHDTFLFYCAARRGDEFRKAKMKKYGWEHISSRRRLRRKCADILAATEGPE